jgi:hypothetical protein
MNFSYVRTLRVNINLYFNNLDYEHNIRYYDDGVIVKFGFFLHKKLYARGPQNRGN